jgi:hypothetical protein
MNLENLFQKEREGTEEMCMKTRRGINNELMNKIVWKCNCGNGIARRMKGINWYYLVTLMMTEDPSELIIIRCKTKINIRTKENMQETISPYQEKE